MRALQKTFLIAVLIIVIGGGAYEHHQTSTLRTQLQTLQHQQTALSSQIAKATLDRENAERQLATLRDENKRLHQNTTDLPKLRSEITRLKAAVNSSQKGAQNSEAEAWLARLEKLKEKLQQTPQAAIPEFQLLNEEDWLDAVKNNNPGTDEDYRRVFSSLRHAGETKFVNLLQPALKKYMESNGNQFPTNLSQLQANLESPVDDAILDRYAILPNWEVPNLSMGGDSIITQKAPVDAQYDQRFGVGPSGWGTTSPQAWNDPVAATMRSYMAVQKAYSAANGGRHEKDLPDLLPYATTPEQQAAIQRMIKNSQPAQTSTTK
jgi:hypothetical protein